MSCSLSGTTCRTVSTQKDKKNEGKRQKSTAGPRQPPTGPPTPPDPGGHGGVDTSDSPTPIVETAGRATRSELAAVLRRRRDVEAACGRTEARLRRASADSEAAARHFKLHWHN